VATAEATVTGGKWGPVSSSTVLGSGEYTAQASEPSSLGNAGGKSEPRTFVINTNPPIVTLEALAPRSNVTKPTFKGTASELGQVTVHVFKGTEPKGEEAVTLKATVNGENKWSVTATNELPDGKYTAVATEPSAIKNPEGKSEPRGRVRNLHQTTEGDARAVAELWRTSTSRPSKHRQKKPEGDGSCVRRNTAETRSGHAKSEERRRRREWSVTVSTALSDWGNTRRVATEPSTIIGNPDGTSEPR
jgi:hypothetical protein